jgi:hypothetical protein
MNDAMTMSAGPGQSAEVDGFRWEGHMSDGVGATYGVAPMASLQGNAEHLVLAGSRGTFNLPRTSIRKLGRGGFYPWFFRGVRIHHNVPQFPAELVFRPLGAREADLFARLRKLGYPV